MYPIQWLCSLPFLSGAPTVTMRIVTVYIYKKSTQLFTHLPLLKVIATVEFKTRQKVVSIEKTHKGQNANP